MPRQQHDRARSSRAPMARASSAERHQKVSREVSTSTTTTEAEQQGRLRRVRSFTMRSGAVVNRGDSFKIRGARGGDNEAELTSRRRYDTQGIVGVDELRQRSHSAATTSRRRLAQDHDDLTDSVVVDGDEITSADKSYTVMVLGSEGVGKTTVTQQLLTSEYLANKHHNVG